MNDCTRLPRSHMMGYLPDSISVKITKTSDFDALDGPMTITYVELAMKAS